MKIINMFRVGITPPQPLFFFSLIVFGLSLFYYYYYVFLGKRLCWWYSKPKYIYYVYEQEDIKLLKTERN